MTQQQVQHRERFFFESSALKQESCKVVRFSGVEGLNTLYSFELTLVSQNFLDMDTFMVSPCTLKIARDQAKAVQFHGFPSSCTQKSHINGWTFYTVTMEPQFSRLRGIVHNAIYLNKNVQEIVDKALEHCGKIKPEYKFNLQNAYAAYEFSMQYNEDVYAYISHFLEREGIYYYFDQQSNQEKVIFSDAPTHHTPIEGNATLTYSPTSGLETLYMDEVVVSFNKMHTPLPKYVHVRDYDWQNPNIPVVATAIVKEQGLGELFFYGDGFTTTDEGQRLANIRAQALRCRGVTFQGSSAVPRLSPGYIFTLEKHFDASCNAQYLITEVRHEGSQEGYLSMMLGITLEHPTDTVYYRNSFTCIEKDVQFRAEHRTERKKISGMIHAFIDAASDSGIPEIDPFGRYKVIFPQDISGREAGRASCWLRRAQPSVGLGYGTSFPLDPGVEVLISFTDGHPDRPFIAAALANNETGTMDHEGNALFSGITTAGGGGLTFHDKGEKQALNLATGSGRSGLFMTSGSLDASILQADHFHSNSSLSSSSSATLANKLSSRISASISASSTYKTKTALLFFLKAFSRGLSSYAAIENANMAIAKDASSKGGSEENFNNAKASYENVKQFNQKVQSGTKFLISLINIFETCFEISKKDKEDPHYITDLLSNEAKSEGKLSLLAPLTSAKDWSIFITDMLLELTAKGIDVYNASRAIHKENKSTIKDSNNNTDTTAESKKKFGQVRYMAATLPPLVAEIIAVVTIFKNQMQAKEFSGVRIKSDDKNVAIASATNTHIASNGSISLIARASTSEKEDNGALSDVNEKSEQALVAGINAVAEIDKPYLYGEAQNVRFKAHNDIFINATHNTNICSMNANIAATSNAIINAENTTLASTENAIINTGNSAIINAKENASISGAQNININATKNVNISSKKNILLLAPSSDKAEAAAKAAEAATVKAKKAQDIAINPKSTEDEKKQAYEAAKKAAKDAADAAEKAAQAVPSNNDVINSSKPYLYGKAGSIGFDTDAFTVKTSSLKFKGTWGGLTGDSKKGKLAIDGSIITIG